MPHFNMARSAVVCAAVALLAFANAAQAAPAKSQTNPDAIPLSGDGNVPPSGIQQPLHLSDAQRAQVRQALAGKQTQVEFTGKKTKSAKGFTPAIGAKLPKGVSALPLPPAVTQKVPQLGDYQYVMMKSQVLIVNGMTHKIVDVFPQT